jgi:hypothetical protein
MINSEDSTTELVADRPTPSVPPLTFMPAVASNRRPCRRIDDYGYGILCPIDSEDAVLAGACVRLLRILPGINWFAYKADTINGPTYWAAGAEEAFSG